MANNLPLIPVQSVAEIGQRVRKARKEQNFTQQTVSGFMDISPRLLSELERGKETAQVGKVMQILHDIGLDVYIVPANISVYQKVPDET